MATDRPAEATDSPSRGDETRNLMLEAGLRLFAEYGYETVTTRRLATEAGVNVAAIAYHFGGKRDLYRAVLQRLVEDTEPRIGQAVIMLNAGLDAAGGDKVKLAGVASMLVSGLTRQFIHDDFMRWRARLVMREYIRPSPDFDVLYDRRVEPLHRAVTRLAAAALGLPPDSPEAKVRAHTVMGQVFVFQVARQVLWRRTGWDGYDADKVALVTREVTQSVLAGLGLLAGDGPGDRL